MVILVAALLLPPLELFRADFKADFADWNKGEIAGTRFEALDSGNAQVGRAARVTLPDPGGQPNWAIGLYRPIPKALKNGQAVELRFWAKSTSGNKLSALLQRGSAPYPEFVRREETLTPEWKEYRASGVIGEDLAPGAANIALQMNYGAGQVELGPSTLVIPDPAGRFEPVDILGRYKFESWRKAGVEATEITGGVRATFAAKEGANPWDHLVGLPLTGEITAGDTVMVKAKVRSKTRSRTTLFFELSTPPHTKFITGAVRLTPEWKEQRFAGRIGQSLAAGGGQFTMFLGYGKGEVEIKDVALLNYGTTDPAKLPTTVDFYGGEMPSVAWRKDALARIEKIRKGNLTVRVVDRRGRPVSGASVTIRQDSHAFRFGTAAPAALILDQTPTGDKFRATLKRFFNTVTLENDLKWTDTARAGYGPPDAAIDWLVKNKFTVRGHNVVWGGRQYLPDGIFDLPADQLRTTLSARATEVVSRYKNQIKLWDVVNEAGSNTALWDKIGWDQFPKVYETAHRANPGALLAYNDYDITEEAQVGTGYRTLVKDRIQKLIDGKAPFDIIGIQAHVGVPITPMPTVYRILDEMAAYKKRLEITEYDLGVQDDRVNGKHLDDFMTVSFSHPAVDAFIIWGFWEGAHWRANEGGAIIRRDWSLRPAAEAFDRLVNRTWRTNTTVQTSRTGQIGVSAFYGGYTVQATKGNRKATVVGSHEKGKTTVLTVKLN